VAKAQIEDDYDVLASAGMTIAEIGNDWLSASRTAVAAAPSEVRTVSYGSDPKLAYDVIRPEGTPRGAIIFLHGGFWVQGSKETVLFPHIPFTHAGLCYVAVTYGLAPSYTLSQMVGNVESAAQSFGELAPSLGVNTSRIVVAGHSAGGYLASALVRTSRCNFRPLGCLSISGLFDLTNIRELKRLAALDLGADEAQRLSISGADLAGKSKMILAVGSGEPAGFQRQTMTMDRQLREAGDAPRYVPVPGNHFTATRRLGDLDSVLVREVLQLFD
jgi:arylformamidase